MALSLRRAVRALVVLPVVAALTALAPTTAQASSGNAPTGQWQLTLMTRNLYLGADLLHVFQNPETGLAQVVGTVEQLNPVQRMQWVANEITGAGPDVVALQEVADWNIAGMNPFNPTQRVVPAAQYDFLALLLADLQANGTPYHVVVSQTNFDSATQLPSLVQALATFSDRDVIIARDQTPTSLLNVLDTRTGHFRQQMNVPLPAFGVTVNFRRGYEWADVVSGARLWRIVNTHPEAYSPSSLGLPDSNDYNGLQMEQLARVLSLRKLPTAVLGDLNSRLGDPSRAGYATIVGAGFADSWLGLGLPDSASTCCRNETLSGGTLDERLDHVLLRGQLTPVSAYQVGVNPVAAAPAPPPYWPSDHAGVVTTVRVGQPPAWPFWPFGPFGLFGRWF